MDGYTKFFWKDGELRIYTDPFCTSCHISSMNKKDRSKNPLKPKAPFKWVFMGIIPETAPKSLTSETTFSNYILIVDAYSNISKLYGMDLYIINLCYNYWRVAKKVEKPAVILRLSVSKNSSFDAREGGNHGILEHLLRQLYLLH